MLESIRFALCALCLTAGVFFEVTAVIGVCRFRYSLNRLHASGVGDTLGMACFVCAFALYFGLSVVSLKLLAVAAVCWMTGPVSGHVISRLEAETSDRIKKEAREWKP